MLRLEGKLVRQIAKDSYRLPAGNLTVGEFLLPQVAAGQQVPSDTLLVAQLLVARVMVQ